MLDPVGWMRHEMHALVLALTACGPKVGAGDDAAASAGDDGTAADTDAGTNATADTTLGDSDVGSSSVGSVDGGDTDGPIGCEDPVNPNFEFSLAPDVGFDPDLELIDTTCQTGEFDPNAGQLDVRLRCNPLAEPFEALLTVRAPTTGLGTLALAPDSQVRLQYARRLVPIGEERWLLVSDADTGAVLIGAVDAEALVSPEGLAPLAVVEPVVLDDDCPPVAAPCGSMAQRRLQLVDGSVMRAGTNRGVFDDTLIVWLSQATLFLELDCFDTPPTWWQVGAVAGP